MSIPNEQFNGSTMPIKSKPNFPGKHHDIYERRLCLASAEVFIVKVNSWRFDEDELC